MIWKGINGLAEMEKSFPQGSKKGIFKHKLGVFWGT